MSLNLNRLPSMQSEPVEHEHICDVRCESSCAYCGKTFCLDDETTNRTWQPEGWMHTTCYDHLENECAENPAVKYHDAVEVVAS